MPVRRYQSWVVIATASLLASGCASGIPVPSWFNKSAGSPTPAAVAKQNNELTKKQAAAQQKAINKQFGVKEDQNAFEKAGSSVAASFTAAGDKITSWFAPKKADTPDAVSLKGSKGSPSSETYLAGATVQEQNGNLDNAAIMLQRALAADPKNTNIQIKLARLYDRQGKFDDAVKIYSQILQAHPNEGGAWNDMGLCQARRGNLEDAAKALRRAVDLQPDRALYRNNLATVLVEMNRVPEAVAQLQAVHGAAVAHYNVGYLLQQRGQNALALQEFRQAAAADPNLQQANDWVAQLSGSKPATASAQLAPPVGQAPQSAPVMATDQPTNAAGQRPTIQMTGTQPRVAARPASVATELPPLQQPTGVQPPSSVPPQASGPLAPQPRAPASNTWYGSGTNSLQMVQPSVQR